MLSTLMFLAGVIGIIELFNCLVFGWEENE
jgi:hypothetical protein